MTPEALLIQSLLRIPDKEGNDVDFILNADQRSFDEQQTGRDIIAKYRQGGFSTYPLARALVRCMAYRNRRHVILAHNSDTSQKLLARVHYMLKHLRCEEKPDLRYQTQNRIVFNKTDSSIFIGTAGSDDYGVGDTITDLHCSEVSRWPNPQALLAGLFQAVPPGGHILLESTGRGVGNWFHQAAMNAINNTGYKLHFFNWLRTPEYAVRASEEEDERLLANLDEGLEEPKYHEAGLSAAQLRWRRYKIAELNYDIRLFKENYPVTLDECFQATGYNVFKVVNYVETPEWQNVDPWTWRMANHPVPGRSYIAGVDVSAGAGLDYSVLVVFDTVSGEQVYEYRNNMIEPDYFAGRAGKVLTEFNNAYVNPERNNHGILFIKSLLQGYPAGRVHKPARGKGRGKDTEISRLAEYGTFTSEVVKGMVIGALQQQAREELTIHSRLLRDEMGSYIEKENGRFEADIGCHDDMVMAAGMMAFARPTAAMIDAGLARAREEQRGRRKTEIFEAGRAFEELITMYESGGDPLPISDGVEWDEEAVAWPQ